VPGGVHTDARQGDQARSDGLAAADEIAAAILEL
jgi:hypothetical protein